MDEETPLSQQKQGSFFHANKNSQLAARPPLDKSGRIS